MIDRKSYDVNLIAAFVLLVSSAYGMDHNWPMLLMVGIWASMLTCMVRMIVWKFQGLRPEQ